MPASREVGTGPSAMAWQPANLVLAGDECDSCGDDGADEGWELSCEDGEVVETLCHECSPFAAEPYPIVEVVDAG